jgi:hypothetical protein
MSASIAYMSASCAPVALLFRQIGRAAMHLRWSAAISRYIASTRRLRRSYAA